MHASKSVWKILVGTIAALILLLPGMLTALVWTPLNLIVALVAVFGTMLVARLVGRLRWFAAILASALIAVPPYPYWMFSDNVRGWYFTFFLGYRVKDVPFLEFGSIFFASMLLFWSIFWSMNSPKTE